MRIRLSHPSAPIRTIDTLAAALAVLLVALATPRSFAAGPASGDAATPPNGTTPANGTTTTPPADEEALAAPFTKEEIETRRTAALTADISDEDKAIVQERFDQAIQAIEGGAQVMTAAAQFRQAITTAARERQEILDRLEATPALVAEQVEQQVAAEAAAMTANELNTRYSEIDAALTTAQGRLQDFVSRIEQQNQRKAAIAKSLAETQTSLDTLRQELALPPDPQRPQARRDARQVMLRAREYLLRAQLLRDQQEDASHGPRLALLQAKQQEAARLVQNTKLQAEAWKRARDQKVQELKADMVKNAQDRLRAAERSASPPPEPLIQACRDIIAWNQLQDELTAKFKRVQSELDDVLETDSRYEQQLAAAKTRIERGGLTESTGIVWRQQRLALPDKARYEQRAESRREEIGDTIDAQTELTASFDRAASDALKQQVLEAMEDASARDKAEAVRIFDDRARLYDDLMLGSGVTGGPASFPRYIEKLDELSEAERGLVVTIEEYSELIDENVLWIRSEAPLNLDRLSELPGALRWFAEGGKWRALRDDLLRSIRRSPVSWAIGLLAVGLLFGLRPRARRMLANTAELTRRVTTDSLVLTFKALLATLLYIAAWPGMLAFIGWQLATTLGIAPFSQAVGVSLLGVAGVWATIGAVRAICRDDGLGGAHFRWRAAVRGEVSRNLLWLLAGWLPVVAIIQLPATVEDDTQAMVVTQLGFVVFLLMGCAFLARSLRPSGAVMAWITKHRPDGWLPRLRFLWWPVIVLTPLLLGVLAGMGYMYTAGRLFQRLYATVWMALGVLLLHALLLRSLYVAYRRLAYREAQRKREELRQQRQQREEKEGETAPEPQIPHVEEPEISLDAINNSTRSLIATATGAAVLIGLWAVWHDVLPALNALDEVALWTYEGVVDGEPGRVPITLANLGLSILLLIVTLLAARNLPGALEMTLLSNLPMDAGVRYAVTQISRYSILAVGIVLGFNALGFQWSSLQWLVAALGVGLGFGLQEIVVNFISGIIILFERPFRVGDIVTVGDTSGTVTRIRIRATTISDFDRLELIVPNKEFVTGRLVNWSLSDPITRMTIKVGVAYGSDTKLAEKLLYKVAKEHPLVLDEPAAMALFLGFGDNSLNFELRIFVGNVTHRLQTLHDLHNAIDDEFKKAGITIAFPQRDLHFDSDKPLQIEMVREARASGKVGG